MSQQNVEIVRALIAAWNARDREAFMKFQHPDVEMTLPRNLLEGGSYRGHEGVRRAFNDAVESWEVNRVRVERMDAVDDLVVMLGRAFNIARGGGPSVDYELAILMRVCDGQIIESRSFLTHAEALETAGLRE